MEGRERTVCLKYLLKGSLHLQLKQRDSTVWLILREISMAKITALEWIVSVWSTHSTPGVRFLASASGSKALLFNCLLRRAARSTPKERGCQMNWQVSPLAGPARTWAESVWTGGSLRN